MRPTQKRGVPASEPGGQQSIFADESAGLRAADIVAPVAVDTAYSYRVPEGMVLSPGDIVDIPLGNRETTGVVWAVRDTRSASNLKTVIARRDLPPLKADLLRFIDWIARWTLSPRGMVLRMAIRASEDFGRFGQPGTRSAMLFLGVGETHAALHNPDYDFPDSLIAPGVAIFHQIAEELLA